LKKKKSTKNIYESQMFGNSRISISLPYDLLRDVTELARKKRTSKSIILTESTILGFREVSIRHAIEEYQRAHISVGRAAEISGLGLAEFMEEMRKRGITPRYSEETLTEEMADK
jgi:predicted HTH domain antitoxin